MPSDRRTALASSHRLLALFGLLGWSLILAGELLITTATADVNPADSPTLIAGTYAEHREDMRLGISLQLSGCFLTLFFLGYLNSRLRSTAIRPDWTGSVVLAAGAVALAVLAFHSAIVVAATNTQIESIPDAAQILLLMDWEYAGVLNPALGALVGAVSLALIRHAISNRPAHVLGWVGIPLAIAMGVSGFLGGFLAWLSLLWLIAAAAAFVLRPEPEDTGQPDNAPER